MMQLCNGRPVVIPVINEEIYTALLEQKQPLTDVEIDIRLHKIEPLIRSKDDGSLYSTMWKNPRASVLNDNAVKLCEARGLHESARVLTLHRRGRGLFTFAPTAAEVYAMIPNHMIEALKGFEIFGPEDQFDVERQAYAVNRGFYVGVAILYS